MKRFPKATKFKYPWRKYQQRVLDELTKHIDDQHLHVVAPPGSGKTVLGLEVALRINHPTLVLVPSIALRQQWIERFVELFLDNNEVPEWISEDIANPAFLTVSTYQALHSAMRNVNILGAVDGADYKAKNSLISLLIECGTQTLILDEAHHLKNEWWRSLEKLKSSLDLKIVGLTATPPYDVPAAEWNRYLALNGPMDAEVSVPELVAAGDLAPHQDFVHLSIPSKAEEAEIQSLSLKIFDQVNLLRDSPELRDSALQHPIFLDPKRYSAWIKDNIESYVALIIFLKANRINIPWSHLRTLRTLQFAIPKLTAFWLERFLEFYLYGHEKTGGKIFKDFYEANRKISQPVESQLKRLGLIERQRVDLKNSRRAAQALSTSTGKLASISEIVKAEESALSEKLRMVILSDYIRDEYLDIGVVESEQKKTKIGIIPIFNSLAVSGEINSKLAVLTGSLVIIPEVAKIELEKMLGERLQSELSFERVNIAQGYLMFKVNDSIRSKIVAKMTDLFELGAFQVLIGTRSLLGEGWDAPYINSLIVASSVGSFVLSNQMRGRAIRIYTADKDKAANIWHLATVSKDPVVTLDLDMILRRFRAFVGINNSGEPSISGGAARVGISSSTELFTKYRKINEQTVKDAIERKDMLGRWDRALSKGNGIVNSIKLPFASRKEYRRERGLFLYRTLSSTFISFASWIIGLSLTYFEVWKALGNSQFIPFTPEFLERIGTWAFLSLAFIGATISFMNLIYYIQMRYLSLIKRSAARALLNTLTEIGAIKTAPDKIELFSLQSSEGEVTLRIKGPDLYETNLFYMNFNELFSPVSDARYLIYNQNPFTVLYKEHRYMKVPAILAADKSTASKFLREWRKRFGLSKLIYTRNSKNSNLLLALKLKSIDEAQSLVESPVPTIESHWE